jgi:hypothetical protein
VHEEGLKELQIANNVSGSSSAIQCVESREEHDEDYRGEIITKGYDLE